MSNKTNNRILLSLLCGGTVAAACAQSSPELRTLYSFTQSVNGGYPNNSVTIGSGGVLYGTTLGGGKKNSGVVYSLTPPASPGGSWTQEVIANFEGNDAAREDPAGKLVAGANGVLYGSTTGDLSDYGSLNGEVYSLRPPAAPGHPWTRTALCTFTPRQGPVAIAQGSKGVLYGITNLPGPGVVFSCAPPASSGDGWSETDLYNLSSGSGSNFYTNLILGGGGVIYSTTNGTVSTGGSVFSLQPPAAPGDSWAAATLFDFPTFADGVNPDGLAMGAGGVLYGSTSLGGDTTDVNCNPAGCGVVFALKPPASPGGAWTQTALHTFTSNPDGAFPNPVTAGPGGVVYGSTYAGGAFGFGTLFSLTPPTSPDGSWTYSLLYSFTGGSDSGNPNGLTLGPDGILYGTTQGVVGNDIGTVFAFRP
jgi:uncharacterized repeat protein (TIGR03803 family)